MRTKALVCAAALAAGAVSTMAQSNVYSLNIVGYVNVTNKVGYALISNPLNTTNNAIDKLFADAPVQTKIIRFVGGTYVTYYVDPDDGWTGPAGPGDVFSLNPGEGVWIQVPAGTAQYVKTYVGEVVQSSTNALPAGYSLKASVLPQAGKVSTDLLFPAAVQDQVIKFVNGSYETYYVDPDDGWTGPAGPGNEPLIGVGEGFWSNKKAAASWTRNFTP